MSIMPIKARKVEDVFVGKYHSFYLNDFHHIYAWGMNNHGQLGVGCLVDTAMPTRIRELDPFEDDYVCEIKGGEHHTVARTKDGVVYCFGKNDEGQIGRGNLYGEYRAKKKAEEAEAKRLEEEAQAAAKEAANAEQQAEGD